MNILHLKSESLAVQVAGDLEMRSTLEVMKRMYKSQDYNTCLEIVRSMAKMPDPSLMGFLKLVLDKEDDVQLQIEATKAIENNGEEGVKTLVKLMKSEYKNYNIIVRHVLDRRIYLKTMGFIFAHIIFYLTLFLFGSYLLLGVFSAIALRKYLRKNSYINYNSLVLSPLSPKISIIAPAFNESKTIIDNIRTLLSLYYNNFEVIIVNDGSTDNTFDLIKDAYDLIRVNYYFDYRIPCERIKGVYRSKNPSYNRLTIIDKNNGGKADSLNAGINICHSDLFVSIDADSIIEADSILKLVKPFLEEKEKKVIGSGGVIRIVNSCDVERGHIREIKIPSKILPRLQVLEYTRAFLLGRMAWSQLDGLMLISGAMGIFDRETVIKAGGYSIKTVGEDMELVLRMRRYMAEHDQKYEVTYIPDPLCWTEVPSDLKSMRKQRTRWTRGLVESLEHTVRLFFNSKYGRLGLTGISVLVLL